MIIEGGKPTATGAGCAWGLLLAPAVLLGGGWALGKIAELLSWLFG